MRTSIRYIVKRDRHVQCIIDESDAFVLYTFKAINLFFVGQKLLSKNAICVRMNLREMSGEYKKIYSTNIWTLC